MMADCRQHAHNIIISPNMNTSNNKCCGVSQQPPLTYAQWRARRLLPSDVQFLLYFILTHVVYGFKTAKHLTTRGFFDTSAAPGSSNSSNGWLEGYYCSNSATGSGGSSGVGGSTYLWWCDQVPVLRWVLQLLGDGITVRRACFG